MCTRTSGHVGEYYGLNFLCTESTSYIKKKEKATIKFMNFSQKYMGSGFGGVSQYNYGDGAKIFIPGREFILRTCEVEAVWPLIPRRISPS